MNPGMECIKKKLLYWLVLIRSMSYSEVSGKEKKKRRFVTQCIVLKSI